MDRKIIDKMIIDHEEGIKRLSFGDIPSPYQACVFDISDQGFVDWSRVNQFEENKKQGQPWDYCEHVQICDYLNTVNIHRDDIPKLIEILQEIVK